MDSLRATRLNNQQFYVLHTHSVFMFFFFLVWIWEQSALISLYSINWLVFINETESVYCVVRTWTYNSGTGSGVGFCSSTSDFPLSVSFHKCYTLIFATFRSYQKDKQSKPGNIPKRNALSEIGEHWIEKYCHFIFKVFQRPWKANVFQLGGSGTWEMWRT